MSKQLPAEGDYTALCNGQITIVKSPEKGTLGVSVPYKLEDSDVPHSDVHTVWFLKSDGTRMESNMDNLKKVFGWDGIDPWWLMWEDPETEKVPRIFETIRFKLKDCKHVERESEKGTKYVTFEPAWLNPIDGQNRFQLAERGEFMKAFGSKFRAAAGPAAKSASKPAAAPSTPPAKKVPGKSAPATEPCTMEDAWGALEKKLTGKSEQERADIWWAKIAELFPGLTEEQQQNLSKEQYGKLRAALTA